MTWILIAITLTGTWLNNRMSVYGFFVWFAANIGWVVHDAWMGDYPRMAMMLVFAALNVHGYIRWTQTAPMRRLKFITINGARIEIPESVEIFTNTPVSKGPCATRISVVPAQN